MEDGPQTWHHGLVAAWWGEFNDDFRPHEVPFYQAHIERSGQPALDAGCGAGRLLLPYLRAGLDVDACDQSADMIEVCREKAIREGFEPNLSVQPMHAIDLPRKYRTIIVVGSFGLGSNRERDLEALRSRIESIPDEIALETRAIEDRYEDQTSLFFPAAVTYSSSMCGIASVNARVAYILQIGKEIEAYPAAKNRHRSQGSGVWRAPTDSVSLR